MGELWTNPRKNEATTPKIRQMTAHNFSETTHLSRIQLCIFSTFFIEIIVISGFFKSRNSYA